MSFTPDCSDREDETQPGSKEQPYRQLFDAIPCYVSVQDRDLKILQINQSFKNAFGNRVGDLCYRAYKNRSKPCPQCNVILTFEDGLVHFGEEEVISRDGDPINMVVYASPIKDESGNVDAVMEMSIDITEVKRLQERLASLGALVAGISHSIKGIAMNLDGSLYVVNSGFRKKSDDVIKKGWDMVERNVNRISSMVLDILYCSKERVPGRQPVTPSKIVTEICDLMEAKAERNNVKLERRIPADEGEFNVDTEAIHSALVNLVANAIDACRNDPVDRDHRVSVRVEHQPADVLFHIVDNGTGIDEDLKERLFSAFESTKGSKGTGLGLFIARKVVTEHGGRIYCESELGKGSEFIVQIPRTAC